MRRHGSIVFVALAACAAPRPAPAPAPVRPAPTSEVAVAPRAPSAPPPDAGAPAPIADVDLLHWTRAAVDVPHKVDNPRDYPEHLVDGKPETAWNGKTGELGGSIHFAVPAEAWIDRIELSAGFDHSGAKGDLFTMNHRITKVAVYALTKDHGEKLLGDFTLDPNQRRPQRIPIKRQGGTFRISVIETVPGTKKGWQELTVSELLVMGDPRSARLPKAQMPVVTIASRHEIEAPRDPVGTADNPNILLALPLTGRSTADVCAAWNKAATKLYGEDDSDAQYPGPRAAPYCALATMPGVVLSGAAATPKLKAVRAVTLYLGETIEDYLLFETDHDFVVPRDASIRWQNRSYDLTKVTSKITGVRFEEPSLAIVTIASVESFAFYCGVGDTSGPTRSATTSIDFDLRCDLAGTPVACTRSERRRECSGPDCQ